MAEKISKEVRTWLKESGYTIQQMDDFWKEAISFNIKVAAISESGRTWRSLDLSVIKDVPNLKQLHEQAEVEKERVAKEKAEREEKEHAEAEYYSKHFDEIMIQKIEKGEPLDKGELSELVHEYGVETHHGSSRRWTRTNTTIISLMGRYFRIYWEEGLTECQEDEYMEQPVEVFKHTYQKMITVTEWVTKPVEEEIKTSDITNSAKEEVVFASTDFSDTTQYFKET